MTGMTPHKLELFPTGNEYIDVNPDEGGSTTSDKRIRREIDWLKLLRRLFLVRVATLLRQRKTLVFPRTMVH